MRYPGLVFLLCVGSVMICLFWADPFSRYATGVLIGIGALPLLRSLRQSYEHNGEDRGARRALIRIHQLAITDSEDRDSSEVPEQPTQGEHEELPDFRR